MIETELEKLKYPIGKFKKPEVFTKELIKSYIEAIETFPARLKKEVEHLTDSQLDTSYREKGWTIRQVVHHCADSHINGLVRLKLALTEDKPTIKPYFEERWAELTDSKTMPVAVSLKLIDGLHTRWAYLLKSLSGKDLEKSFIHPEHGRELNLKEYLGSYAWHCNHHLAHITTLKQKMGW